MTSKRPVGWTTPTRRRRSTSRRRGRTSIDARWAAAALWALTVAPATAQAPDDGRAARLATIRAHLAERADAHDAHAFAPAWATRLAELHAEWAAGEKGRFIAVSDGWIIAYSTRLVQLLNPSLELLEPEWEPEILETIVATIVDVRKQLDEHGVELIVAPIPTRLHVYPELVVDGPVDAPTGHAPGLTRFELALVDAGVEVLDLLEPLVRARAGTDATAPDAAQVFLRSNSHWAPRGVVAAADALTARLCTSPWYSAPDAITSWIDPIETTDLDLRQVHLDDDPPPFQLERVRTENGALVDRSDRESPLVIFGDSFATNYLSHGADIGRQLHHRLGFAPDTLSSDGGGAYASRAIFARRKNALDGKRAVVWMFSIAALLKPAKKWRPVDLVTE